MLAAFVLAPLVPAFFVASLVVLNDTGYALFVLMCALLLGYFPTVVVGLPLYVLARRRVRPTLLNCALAGAFVADLPWLVVGLASKLNATRSDLMTQIGLIGMLGAMGGGVFWLVVRGTHRTPANHTPQDVA